MGTFEKNIDNLITTILNEEIEAKVKRITENKGEWEEIEVKEKLHGNQKKLDVAAPKGKLTAADFEKLRSKKNKKKEMDEFFYNQDNSTPGDYEGDEEAEEKAEKLSSQEPTYVGRGLEDNKIYGSFSDEEGWYDGSDKEFKGNFDFDYDEEEFDEFEPMFKKYANKTRWFSGDDQGRKFFDLYKEKYGPMKIRTRRDMDEAETDEGNAFTGALANAKKEGDDTFKVGDKEFKVRNEAQEKKWIQKTDMKKGALHKKLNVPEDEKIPQAKLKALKKELMKKAEGDKKLSASDSKLLKQVNLALTLKGLKENTNKVSFTEDELIDFIENIVLEQKVKDKEEKNNISKKEPEGLKKTNKALAASKKENEDYAKSVVKKMKEYVKAGSNGEFNEQPEEFPENNYQLNDMKEKTKKYHPSQAVDEYIEAFAYPGQTNIVYDEIKPEDERIEMYIKGNSKTGNAEVDESGKALGNVVPSKTGDRFMKNYKENLYGAQQMKASYKRQPQPVEVAGEEKSSGSLKKIKNSSLQKSEKILNQLESVDRREVKVINEDINKMKNLISYNRKTQ